MNKVRFAFSGVSFEVSSETPFTITKNFNPFLTENSKADYRLQYLSRSSLGDMDGEMLYEGLEYDVVQKADGKIIRIFKDPKEDYVYASAEFDMDEKIVNISYLRGAEQYFDTTNNSFFHSGWEQLLAWSGRMILHASLIETEFGGILFSGVSGVGKSTQADLWMQYESAGLINGDRPIVYKKAGKWFASGSPYAGSSECYINKSIPIRAIIFLQQGNETRLERVKITEAVKRLYANCTVYTWDKTYIEKIFTRITELAAEVPIYYLVNKADASSVEAVKKEMKKDVAV